MFSKRVLMIILAVILVVTLACVHEGDSPTRTPAPEGPAKVPPSSLYYTTTAGSITVSSWGWWHGSIKTITCTANDVQVELIIWLATGEVYLNTRYYGFTADYDNESCDVRASDTTGYYFTGSMLYDDPDTYVHWDTCGPPEADWRASGTAVREGLINLLHLDDLTYDDVFIGGATCDIGNTDAGLSESFDFTLSYRGEYKP